MSQKISLEAKVMKRYNAVSIQLIVTTPSFSVLIIYYCRLSAIVATRNNYNTTFIQRRNLQID